MAKEMIETVLSQPTTFQFKRRKNISGSVGLLIRHDILLDDQVDEEARDEDRGKERERSAPEERVGEAFHRTGSEQEQDAGADDRRNVAIEHRVKARRKPIFTAERSDLPAQSSSLRRSKISTFASTAIPIESTKPAMPGSVRTACAAESSASSATTYTISATSASRPGRRYITAMK